MGHSATHTGPGHSLPHARRSFERRPRFARRIGFAGSLMSLAFSVVAVTQGPEAVAGDGSHWSRRFGDQAPTDPNSANIMAFIRADSTTNYVRISGGTQDGLWGTPVYHSGADDPTYRIHNSCGTTHAPPEFDSVRIPVGAKPDPTSDASMVVIDSSRGKEYALWHAAFNGDTQTWHSCGGSVYYLASNELAGSLKQSNERRNYGHRGIPPDILAVTWQELQSGSIDHVLRVAVNNTKCKHVFPMSGDECGSWAQWAPPEGAIMRIKQSVDLGSLGLSAPALVVARALQHYGAVIGDQSGGPVEIKLENTVAEGRGWLWKSVLSATSMSRIPLSSFEIIKLGYDG